MLSDGVMTSNSKFHSFMERNGKIQIKYHRVDISMAEGGSVNNDHTNIYEDCALAKEKPQERMTYVMMWKVEKYHMKQKKKEYTQEQEVAQRKRLEA